MQVQAEISLYPIGRPDPLPSILQLIGDLERAGLHVEPGPLSTLVSGDCRVLFDALAFACETVGRTGRHALVIKILSSPPEPDHLSPEQP